MADTWTPGDIAASDQKVAYMQNRILELIEGMRLHKAEGCPHINCPGNDVVKFLQEESVAAPAGWLLISLAMLYDRECENPLTALDQEFGSDE